MNKFFRVPSDTYAKQMHWTGKQLAQYTNKNVSVTLIIQSKFYKNSKINYYTLSGNLSSESC